MKYLPNESDVDEVETSDSEEEESNQKFDIFLGHFNKVNFQAKKVSRCMNFLQKCKRGYGCTKKTKVLDAAGWRCCGKQNKDELTTEKVLPVIDKEKSYNRK